MSSMAICWKNGTLCIIFVTKGKIPLYYGSSFSYIAGFIVSRFGLDKI